MKCLAQEDKNTTLRPGCNFHARAARSQHIHNKFKNSFQSDGMDKSNKHCKQGGVLS